MFGSVTWFPDNSRRHGEDWRRRRPRVDRNLAAKRGHHVREKRGNSAMGATHDGSSRPTATGRSHDLREADDLCGKLNRPDECTKTIAVSFILDR